MVRISLLVIFIFSASGNAQSLAGAVHIFKNGSPEQVAKQIYELSSQKLTYSELQQLFDLLNDKTPLKNIGPHCEIRDLAVIIFKGKSHICPSKRDRQVKAIISFKNKEEKIYRYHLSELKGKEFSSFKTKVQNWLLKKIPA